MNAIATDLFDTDNRLPELPTRLRETPDLLFAMPRPSRVRLGTGTLPGVRILAGVLVGTLAAALVFAWPGAVAAAPLAWAFGWLYLAWAVDASRLPAAITDGLLGLVTLAAGLLIVGNTAGPIWLFAMHAIAWPARALVQGRDARSPAVAALWMSFHAVMALLLL